MKANNSNMFFVRLARHLSGLRMLRYLPVLVLGISLLLTFKIWKSAQLEDELALQIAFDFDVQENSLIIQRQMRTFDEMLRGMQGLFMVNPHLTRKDFREYVDVLDLQTNYPGVQGLGFTLMLPPEKVSAHIAEVRRQGYPDYTIKPEGKREVYSTVLYVEPFRGRNIHAFGFDNFADPLRRPAMERVRDTGLCTISPKIKLVQEIDPHVQPGFLMWLPVYQRGARLDTVAQRRSAFIGWVGASFRMQNLVHSIFTHSHARVALEIFDGEQLNEADLMYRDVALGSASNTQPSLFQKVVHMHIAGRTWSVKYYSRPEFDRHLGERKHRLIAYAGLTISLLLTLITGLLVYGRNRAEHAAQVLQQELYERTRVEAGLRLAETVVQNVDAAVLVTDSHGNIIKVNPAFTQITGYTAEEAVGKTTALLSSGAHSKEFYRDMWSALNKQGNWQGEIFNRRKNGEFYTEWLSINAVYDANNEVSNYVALFSDISERKAAEKHMQNLAHYDPLTGLPNRTLLADRLQQAIVSAKRDRHHMALMFVDLDRFKPINDELGHHIGDILLKDVARRMLGCIRESDTAARIGGDEFVVLLPVIEVEADVLGVAEKIRKVLAQKFVVGTRELNISCSIGVAVYPEHGADEKELLKHADLAMYKAKEAGRNRVVYFAPGMER